MLKLVSPTCLLVLAVVGGVFFGLFSCGGYVWHRQLFWLVFGYRWIERKCDRSGRNECGKSEHNDTHAPGPGA